MMKKAPQPIYARHPPRPRRELRASKAPRGRRGRITPSIVHNVLDALHSAWSELEEPEDWTVEERAELSETIGCLIATLNEEGYS